MLHMESLLLNGMVCPANFLKCSPTGLRIIAVLNGEKQQDVADILLDNLGGFGFVFY